MFMMLIVFVSTDASLFILWDTISPMSIVEKEIAKKVSRHKELLSR